MSGRVDETVTDREDGRLAANPEADMDEVLTIDEIKARYAPDAL